MADGGGGGNDMRAWLIAVLSTMTVLATVVVGLRLASRRITHIGYWWDDWVMALSMCWNLVCDGFFISAMYSEGLGVHVSQIGVDHVVTMAQLLLAAEIMYAWNLCLTRVSVLLLFYRIFHLSTPCKVYLLATGIFVMVWAVIATLVFLLGCIPMQKIWYPTIPGTCMEPKTVWLVNLGVSVLSNVAIFLFPIPQLWGARYSWTEKLGLAVVFGSGL
ncbi:hypothetical protein BD289DRAFT_486908 [Coniella lustricola]|uniref:Rhodopsin domain-containing protein n=1 Tax=Coniella lustricola TaxID=2025994 RepID=A0A2T2ZTJ5_9PEZI|nr:hypothetical protein BD289DRAFT_486908 [Coniella lustricola]